MENNYSTNGKAIASLVVSCVSIVCCCAWQVSILCGVIGIVLGILALRGENRRNLDLAVAGIVVGGTGLAIGIVSAILFILLYSSQTDQVPSMQSGSDTVLMAVHSIINVLK